jgi:hypothetical protein
MTKKDKKKIEVTLKAPQPQKGVKPKKKKGKSKKPATDKYGFRIMDCTYKYILAKTDPFNPEAVGACVPRDNYSASQKNHAFVRLSMLCNTYGYAVAWIMPCLANDRPVIYYSRGSSTISGATPLNLAALIAANEVDVVDLPTPYNTASLFDSGLTSSASSVKGRIVSGGFRWWYAGTELNRSGWSTAFVSPSHSSIESETPNSILGRATANVIPNAGRQKHNAAIFGIRAEEFAYTVPQNGSTASVDELLSNYPYSSGVSSSVASAYGAPIAVLIWQGVHNTAHELEYCQHSEYIGAPTTFMATKNYSDPQGASLADEAVASIQSNPSVEPTTKNTLKTMLKIVQDNKSHMINVGSAMSQGRYGDAFLGVMGAMG